MVSKEKWVEIMKPAGFSQDDTHRWHAQFEKSAPGERQEFLAAEIRERSRGYRAAER